jgi:type VI secretion system protein ImpA
MPLRDDLLTPIPGSNPSGQNLHYAPVYDQIKEARREEDTIAQGDWKREIKKADWPLVIKLCGESLAKKSKDLQLAAWLTEAHLRREGFAGLKEGLDLLRGLLETFWDTLYPEIEDGDAEFRATPLDWAGSKLDQPVRKVPLTRGGTDWFGYKESRSVPYEEETSGNDAKQQTRANAIADKKLTPEEFDADFNATPKASYQKWAADVDACLESLDALNGLSEEKFGNAAPSFTGLRKTLEEVKQTLRVLLAKKRETEPDEDEAAGDEGVQEEVGTAAEPAAVAPARARVKPGAIALEPADRDDAIGRIVIAARYLRQNDAYNPVPYLMLRALRFGELRAGGSDLDVSLLAAPPTETRQELKRAIDESDWQKALDTAEAAMELPCGRGWLDLERHAANACTQLGYYAPAAAIRAEVRSLLADYPALPDASLADDTPAANGETRKWIEELVSAQAPKENLLASPSPGTQAEETSGAPDAYELALDAARSGNVEEAIGILTREAARESSGRGRFQRHIQLAQVCLGAGHPAIARPILEEVAREVECRKLEGWEALDSIARPLSLLFRCLEKLDASPEEKEKIYAWLCRLDPVAALALSK